MSFPILASCSGFDISIAPGGTGSLFPLLLVSFVVSPPVLPPDVPPDDVPPDDVPSVDVSPDDVPPDDVPPDDVPSEDVSPDDVPPDDVPPSVESLFPSISGPSVGLDTSSVVFVPSVSPPLLPQDESEKRTARESKSDISNKNAFALLCCFLFLGEVLHFRMFMRNISYNPSYILTVL